MQCLKIDVIFFSVAPAIEYLFEVTRISSPRFFYNQSRNLLIYKIIIYYLLFRSNIHYLTYRFVKIYLVLYQIRKIVMM